MKLRTTDTQHQRLWEIVIGAHESSDTVRVSKEALRNLLEDHLTLNGAVLKKTGALPETSP